MTKSGEGLDSLSALSQRKAEWIERCLREMESCRAAQANPNLTVAEKIGALQGEVDWLVELRLLDDSAKDGARVKRLSGPDDSRHSQRDTPPADQVRVTAGKSSLRPPSRACRDPFGDSEM